MSLTNEEILRQVAAGAARRDLATLLELSHPEVEWHSSLSVISEGGAYHGYDGVRQYVRDLEEAFTEFDTIVDDVVSIGEVAVAVGRIKYKGRTSGVALESTFGWVFRFRDSKVVYIRAFREPEQALGALGGPEPGAG
jgi:ketosteroid isomerase-like protein